MIPMECALSRLGSRFTLNFKPHAREVWVSALGKFLDDPADLAVVFRLANGGQVAFPFTKAYPNFAYVEQEYTMNGVTFRGHSAELGLRAELQVTAPFYPRDVRLSIAPFFYVTITVEPLSTGIHWQRVPKELPRQGELVLKLQREVAEASTTPEGLRWEYEVPLVERRGQSDRTFTGDASLAGAPRAACTELLAPLEPGLEPAAGAFVLPLDLEAGPQRFEFIWAAHTGAHVMEAHEEPRRFKYTESLGSVEEVVAYARGSREDILRRNRRFEGLFTDSSLTKVWQDFLAFSFQSYLLNTWWTVSDEGDDWFSVWEGICLYNSTVDVEYNLALFYLAFWPELLELTLDEWVHHLQPGGFLSHDMGAGLKANGQSYPHAMEVEESANFILLMFAHWRWTGSETAIFKHFEAVKALANYIEAADTTKNGFPDRGTANTIDDASPAIQLAREQTYLGVKASAALNAASVLAESVGDEDHAARWATAASRTPRTLDAQAWLGDHYAVCLDRSAEGLTDVWTGDSLAEEELEGWDAYSVYTSNGLLYLLLTGHETFFDLERMRTDLVSATRESLLEYGCTHSSADRSNVWISQNLWRDFVAAYLGVDQLDLVERYWAFEQWANAREQGKCFIDTYLANNLCYYPRGITAIGVLFAALGLQVDRVGRRVTLAPVHGQCRLPLVAFANWEAEIFPWVECTVEGDTIIRRIIHGELLSDLRIE